MDTTKRVMDDGMKRKRGTPAEDPTPDLERGGPCKKRNGVKDHNLSAANTAITDTTGDTHTGSISSDTNTTRNNKNNTPNEAPSKPTLQTLPRELRDLIYDFVAATEERIVLGRRMTEARNKRYKTETLYESFKGAIALHPLSMTSHQFLDEFQEVHITASEARWTLVVNNFDLDQIRHFSKFIQSRQYIKVATSSFSKKKDEYWEDWEHQVPSYNFPVSLRFQMDNHGLKSANDLRRHLVSHEGEAPESLANPNISKRWFGVAEIATQYVPRTSAPVKESQCMTLEQAREIRSIFGEVRDTLFCVLDEMQMLGERHYGGEEIADSYDYMEWCWFEPFYDAYDRMKGANDDSE